MPTTRTPFTFVDDPRSPMRGVTYKAAIYCVPCAVRTVLDAQGLEGHELSYVAQEALDLMGRFQLGRAWRDQDEYAWDTDDFPKWVYSDMIGDEYECCATCGQDILGRS